jgi:hypothetical protein
METTVVLGREVLFQCLEDFEWYASNRKRLKLQLSSFDVYAIERLYPQANVRLETKLLAVVDDILKNVGIPFYISPIMRGDMSKLVFYSRIEHIEQVVGHE